MTEIDGIEINGTDVNAVVVHGLVPATRAAVEEWKAMGAPLPRGYAESTRANVKGWPDNGTSTQEVYRLAVHFIGEAKYEATRLAKAAAMARRRAQRDTTKEAMTAEMRTIRAALGLSQTQLNVRFNLKPGVITNAERAGGTYGNDFVASLLERYRVEAQLINFRPPKAKPAAKP